MNRSTLKLTSAAMMFIPVAMLTTPSFAAGNWYAGGAFSQAYVDEQGLDDNDTGGKIFGGYRINKNFAVEGSYYDFGDFEDGANKLSIDGFSLGLVGSVPLSERFSAFAKVGVHTWDANFEGTVGPQFSDDSGTDVFYGAGLDFAMNSSWTIRGEYERYEVDNFNLDVASIGIVYNF